MDKEAVKAALAQFRKNRRRIRQERGLEWITASQDLRALGNEEVFEGVDATPEEIILYLTVRSAEQATMNAKLLHWAVAGLATEMTMHEARGHLMTLSSAAESLEKKYPQDKIGARIGETAEALDENFSFLTRCRKDNSRYSAPAKVVDNVLSSFWRQIERGELQIVKTEAFKTVEGLTGDSVMTPVIANLITNAYQWASRAGKSPCVITFDARKVAVRREGEDGVMEDGEETILSVTDNGPGINPDLADRVFDPGVSGRGSTGIGLHLCRALLESTWLSIVLDPEQPAEGGTRFLIGPRRLIRPEPGMTPSAVCELIDAVSEMTALVREGHASEAASLAGIYGEAVAMATKIRLLGAVDEDEQILVDVCEGFEESLRQVRSPSAGPSLG